MYPQVPRAEKYSDKPTVDTSGPITRAVTSTTTSSGGHNLNTRLALKRHQDGSWRQLSLIW